MKTCVLLVGLIVSQITCLGEDKPVQNEKREWDRSYMLMPAPDGKERGLRFLRISQGSEHLVGTLVLERRIKGTVPLVLQGHLNKEGEFTANVSLEVSDRENGSWKPIESSFSDRVDMTLTGAPHIDKLFFVVQLDALQPYIGKFRFCRVSLQTGESDIFPMVWLTREGKESEPNR
jgi:hypothetical protein